MTKPSVPPEVPPPDAASDAAALFYRRFQEVERMQTRRQSTNEKLVQEKNLALVPIRRLLKTLMDAGVHVTHEAATHSSAAPRSEPPQPLQVYEHASSPHWQPGSSLYLSHPAVIEIAVCNHRDRAEEGLVRIACSSNHPDAHLLQGPFHTSNDAVRALADFLGRSTVRVDRPEALRLLMEGGDPDEALPPVSEGGGS